MLWIIFRCIEIGIQFIITAPFHKIDSIFCRPWISIIPFNKSTTCNICPVLNVKIPDGITIHLLQNMIQRRQSIITCICVCTYYSDHIIITIQYIGVQLFIQIRWLHIHMFICVSICNFSRTINSNKNIRLALFNWLGCGHCYPVFQRKCFC